MMVFTEVFLASYPGRSLRSSQSKRLQLSTTLYRTDGQEIRQFKNYAHAHMDIKSYDHVQPRSQAWYFFSCYSSLEPTLRAPPGENLVSMRGWSLWPGTWTINSVKAGGSLIVSRRWVWGRGGDYVPRPSFWGVRLLTVRLFSEN